MLIILTILYLSAVGIKDVPGIRCIGVSSGLIRTVFCVIVPVALVVRRAFLVHGPPSVGKITCVATVSVTCKVLVRIIRCFLPCHSTSFCSVLTGVANAIMTLVVCFVAEGMCIVSYEEHSAQ